MLVLCVGFSVVTGGISCDIGNSTTGWVLEWIHLTILVHFLERVELVSDLIACLTIADNTVLVDSESECSGSVNAHVGGGEHSTDDNGSLGELGHLDRSDASSTRDKFADGEDWVRDDGLVCNFRRGVLRVRTVPAALISCRVSDLVVGPWVAGIRCSVTVGMVAGALLLLIRISVVFIMTA